MLLKDVHFGVQFVTVATSSTDAVSVVCCYAKIDLDPTVAGTVLRSATTMAIFYLSLVLHLKGFKYFESNHTQGHANKG